ncbi:hypothetical protein GIR35_12430 [Enterococcus faecalis]|nr:hypothetical protein GIR35_12430 [Enterococcus faecalis]
MKPSDLISTSGQRDVAGQSLLHTEMTDAVNSGIVCKTDKSEKSLKGELYSVSKKNPTGGAIAAMSAVTKGKSAADSSSALASQGVHETLSGSELEGTDDLYHGVMSAYRAGRAVRNRLSGKSKPLGLKVSAKNTAKAATRGVTSHTLSDSELEGADSVYYGAKKGYRIGKGLKLRLSGRNAIESDKPLGSLSEKKSAQKAIGTVEAKRKAQAMSYLKKNVYKTAEKAKTTTTATKSIISVAKHSGGSGFLAAFSPFSALFPIILLLLFFMLVLGGMGADEAQRKSAGSLEGVPAEVATILKGYGYTNEGIAAILGNMQQESSMNPGTAGDDGYGTASVGLIQLSGSNKNSFLRWCGNNGKTWYSVAAQMEWSFSGEPGTGHFIEDWSGVLAASYYELEDGYEERFGRDFYRDGEHMKNSTDVDLATYSFMACHERCGSRKGYGDDVSRLDKRLEYARGFLAQMSVGSTEGGQDYSSAEQWQKDLVDTCQRVPWPGASLCATWTSNVYRSCGHEVYGNGNSVLGHQGYGASYYPSRATTDFSKIKVGMLVSAQYGSNSAAGNTYGHVGIYIGDGMVMDSVNTGVRTISLSDWVSQNNRGWVVCGYPWDWH